MADLTTQQLTPGSAVPTFSAASSGGDSYVNGLDTVLLVKNGDASDKTVILASQVEAVPGVAPADHQVTVPSGGGIAVISLEGNARFRDENGRVQVSYSDITSVEVAAVSYKS